MPTNKTLDARRCPALDSAPRSLLIDEQVPGARLRGDSSPRYRSEGQGTRDTNPDRISCPLTMLGDAQLCYGAILYRLDDLQAAVNQGCEIDTAIFFARFLLNSRILTILEETGMEGRFPRTDLALMRWKAEELQRSVQELWRTGKAVPAPEVATLQALGRKLDLIAGHVAKLAVPDVKQPTPRTEPELRVMEGVA